MRLPSLVTASLAVTLLTLGGPATASAQLATFTVTGDAVPGGYIPELSWVANNTYNIGLDPTDSLATSILRPTRFASGGVSGDTLMLRISAPAGYIVKKVYVSQTYYRFTSRQGSTRNHTAAIIDGTPLVTSPISGFDLTSRNKQEIDMALTTFLSSYAPTGSANIRMDAAHVRVDLAPAQP